MLVPALRGGEGGRRGGGRRGVGGRGRVVTLGGGATDEVCKRGSRGERVLLDKFFVGSQSGLNIVYWSLYWVALYGKYHLLFACPRLRASG